MPGPPSRRERIIANVLEVVKSSGIVRGATDEPPFGYLEKDPSWAWVFEGNEMRLESGRKLAGKTERALEIHVHQTYRFVPGDPLRDLHAFGRTLLADMQTLLMADLQRGGAAWLTEEGGNAIGTPVGTEKPIGILATIWVVRYDTPFQDPRG